MTGEIVTGLEGSGSSEVTSVTSVGIGRISVSSMGSVGSGRRVVGTISGRPVVSGSVEGASETVGSSTAAEVGWLSAG
jgi:hypothetical protein